jgi:hypothetical protein
MGFAWLIKWANFAPLKFLQRILLTAAVGIVVSDLAPERPQCMNIPIYPLFDPPLASEFADIYEESKTDAIRLIYLRAIDGARHALLSEFVAPGSLVFGRNCKKDAVQTALKLDRLQDYGDDEAFLLVQPPPFHKFGKLADTTFLVVLKTVCELWMSHGAAKSTVRQQVQEMVEDALKSPPPGTPTLIATFAEPLCALPGGIQAAKAGGVIAGLGLLLGFRCCLEVTPEDPSKRVMNFYRALAEFGPHFRHPMFSALNSFIGDVTTTDQTSAAPGKFASSTLAADFLRLVDIESKPDKQARKAQRDTAKAFLRPLLEALQMNAGERFGAARAMTISKVNSLIQPLLDTATSVDNEIVKSESFTAHIQTVRSAYEGIILRAAQKDKRKRVPRIELKPIQAIEQFLRDSLPLLVRLEDSESIANIASKFKKEDFIADYISHWVNHEHGGYRPKRNKTQLHVVVRCFALWLHGHIGDAMWWQLCDQRDAALFGLSPRPLDLSLWEELLADDNLRLLLDEHPSSDASKVWNNVTTKFLERLARFTDTAGGEIISTKIPTPGRNAVKRRNSRRK